MNQNKTCAYCERPECDCVCILEIFTTKQLLTMKDQMPKKYDMEHQWQLFLHRVNLREKDMKPIQIQAMRHAFFGALGQLLVLLNNDIAKETEQDAVKILEYLQSQVGKFWENEITRNRKN